MTPPFDSPSTNPTEGEIEAKLIRRMERLAREWPKGYMLASMGGSLCLFRSDDRMMDNPRVDGEGLDPEKQLWGTDRIPNTGRRLVTPSAIHELGEEG